MCGPTRSPLRAAQCFWYTHPLFPRYNLSLTLHLACILPAGLLALPQFVPAMRRRFPRLHRYTGRASFALALPGIAAVPGLLDRSFGGGLDVQSSSLLLAGLTTWAVARAWAAARARRFAEHARWATRAWVWLGCVVTHRAVMGMFAAWASLGPVPQRAAMSCGEVWNLLENVHGAEGAGLRWATYPECSGAGLGARNNSVGVLEQGVGMVTADVFGGGPEGLVGGLQVAFGAAFWVAILLHVVGTEVWFARKAGAKGVKGAEEVRVVEVEDRAVGGKGLKEL
jgi:hypothetical protein